MKKSEIVGLVLTVSLLTGILVGCDIPNQNTDKKQAVKTEEMMKQADSKLGLPNIKNFYEKKMMKDVMEACDDANLITYAYMKNDMTGKLTYLGQAMGYGLPYGTEYTNPEYVADSYQSGYAILPQPDPNGLYKAQNVNATWVMLIDPSTKKAKPMYFEPNVVLSPFKLEKRLLDISTLPSDY